MPLGLCHAAPRQREVLIERARQLAHSLEEQSAAERLALAIVGLSAEYFSVELETVREFTDLQRLTPVPCCPDYIVGDMNLRGAIVTVVDIRSILRMSVQAPAPTAKVIVVPLLAISAGILLSVSLSKPISGAVNTIATTGYRRRNGCDRGTAHHSAAGRCRQRNNRHDR